MEFVLGLLCFLLSYILFGVIKHEDFLTVFLGTVGFMTILVGLAALFPNSFRR